MDDTLDEIKKARELIVDDENFAFKDSHLVPDMLELLSFSRIDDYWAALFRTKYRPDHLYEATYDEKKKTVVIFTYDVTRSSIIHE